MSKEMQVLYWLIVGSTIGLGAILVFSLGLPLLLLGLGLLLYGIRKFGPQQLWLVLTAMGSTTAGLLLFQYYTAPGCTTASVAAPCISFPPGYPAVAAVFLALAVLGLIWGLILRYRSYAR